MQLHNFPAYSDTLENQNTRPAFYAVSSEFPIRFGLTSSRCPKRYSRHEILVKERTILQSRETTRISDDILDERRHYVSSRSRHFAKHILAGSYFKRIKILPMCVE